MDDYNFFSDTLKQSGLRVTPQRIAIYKLLYESVNHPTATQIYEEIRKQYPTISLMTVYNALDTFVHQGLISSLGSVGDDTIHYDGNTTSHINLACISCHQILDENLTQYNNLEVELAQSSGYRIIGARILYYGYCPDCQQKMRN